MFAHLIFYLLYCFTLIQSYETFDLYQPQNDRQFLTGLLTEQSPWLLDVIPLKCALEQLEDSSHLSILKVDNNHVGFICYEILNKTYLGFPVYQYGFINGIAVAGKEQKKGYGKKLIQHAIDELKNDFFPYVRLQVKSDNDAAIGFYRHLGFKQIQQSIYHNLIEYYQFELQLK